MKSGLKFIACGMGVVALSACMGGGDDDGGTVVSNGILSLEVPEGQSYDDLPDNALRTMVDNVVASNTSAANATVPGGSTDYQGTFGMSVGEGFVWGDASLNVDNSSNVSYQFDAQEIEDPDFANAEVDGSVSGSTSLSGGTFSGGFNDDATLDYDPDGFGAGDDPIEVTLSGTVEGAFDSSSNAFGGMTGNVTGDGVDESFLGLFFAPLD